MEAQTEAGRTVGLEVLTTHCEHYEPTSGP
jgi:hypothetical protein